MGERRRGLLARRLVGFDQRRLLYLHEAVAAGSMTTAAERLGTSTSSLSRNIAKIEAEVQVPLLERRGRGVVPTEAGLILLKFYEELRENLDYAVTEISDLVSLRRGTVAIATGEGFLNQLLGAPLTRFVERYPALKIDMQFGHTDELTRRILDDAAHIGLIYNPPNEPRLHNHASKCQPMCAIVRPGHPLTGLGRQISIADLVAHEVAMLPNSFGVRQALLTAEQTRQLRLSSRFTANSSRALMRLAQEVGIVAVSPAFAAEIEVAAGHLVALPFGDPGLAATEARLVTRRGRKLPVPAIHMLNHLRRHLAIVQ
jgi:DNA-binding transcriptional LysR family regulator